MLHVSGGLIIQRDRAGARANNEERRRMPSKIKCSAAPFFWQHLPSALAMWKHDLLWAR